MPAGIVRGEQFAPNAGGTADQFGAGAVGADRVGQQALIGYTRGQDHGASRVAEQRVSLLVVRIDHSRIAICADHQCPLAASAGYVLHAGDQGESEARASGLHVEGRGA